MMAVDIDDWNGLQPGFGLAQGNSLLMNDLFARMLGSSDITELAEEGYGSVNVYSLINKNMRPAQLSAVQSQIVAELRKNPDVATIACQITNNADGSTTVNISGTDVTGQPISIIF